MNFSLPTPATSALTCGAAAQSWDQRIVVALLLLLVFSSKLMYAKHKCGGAETLTSFLKLFPLLFFTGAAPPADGAVRSACVLSRVSHD